MYPDVAFPPLVPARLVRRPLRFLVLARRGRRLVEAACRDPGRLSELLVPGAHLLLAPAEPGRRRTAFTLMLVRHAGGWVSAVPVLANALLAAALARSGAAGLRGARVLAREVALGRNRVDFLLRHRGRRLLTEVKSATLVERGRALFPDAPTVRGTRQLRELARHGAGALVVFVVQRADASRLSPHAALDPEFARALREAARAGVGLKAYACRVGARGIRLARRIPIEL